MTIRTRPATAEYRAGWDRWHQAEERRERAFVDGLRTRAGWAKCEACLRPAEVRYRRDSDAALVCVACLPPEERP